MSECRKTNAPKCPERGHQHQHTSAWSVVCHKKWMRKRYENRRSQRQQELCRGLAMAESEICRILNCPEGILQDPTANTPWFSLNEDQQKNAIADDIPQQVEEINWINIPDYLDPAVGELNELRAKRKRQQLESLIFLIEKEIEFRSKEAPLRIIDFGAGSGHLGLIVAYRNPHVQVLLIERKEYSVNVAKERIAQCHLSNVAIDQRDLQEIFHENPYFGIGISLHSCGQLTDLSLQLCSAIHASFVLTPCCYGQVSHPPPLIDPITQLSTPSIPMTQFSALPLINDQTIFPLIVSNADYSNSFDDSESSYEKNQFSFLLAKRCMRVVDCDRLIHHCRTCQPREDTMERTAELPAEGSPGAVEGGDGTGGHQTVNSNGHYIFRLTSLFPLTCSPKNNVIIGRYLSPTPFLQPLAEHP
jgi:hypothetical protein